MQLNEQEKLTITSALMLAAEQYRKDAKDIKESQLGEYARTRLVEQFETQAMRCTILAEKIEEE